MEKAVADPDALISTGEAQQQLEHGDARLLIVGEGSRRPARGLPPGAAYVKAGTLLDGTTRDVARPAALAALGRRAGIGAATTLILGDAAGGPHAAFAYWTFALYGHTRLRIMDGGLPAWARAGQPLEDAAPSFTDGDYAPGALGFSARVLREDVRQHLDAGALFLDVRSPAEFSGALLAPVDAPQEGIRRGGHLPGALNIPWTRALRPDGTFQPPDELAARYRHAHDLSPGASVIVYSRTAARACHTWFVLTRLLGFSDVRVYDGGWAEWGNLVGAPVERSA